MGGIGSGRKRDANLESPSVEPVAASSGAGEETSSPAPILSDNGSIEAVRASLRERLGGGGGPDDIPSPEEARPRRSARAERAATEAREARVVEGVQLLARGVVGLVAGGGSVGVIEPRYEAAVRDASGATMIFAELCLAKWIGPDAQYIEEIGLGLGVGTILAAHVLSAVARRRRARVAADPRVDPGAPRGGEDDSGAVAGITIDGKPI